MIYGKTLEKHGKEETILRVRLIALVPAYNEEPVITKTIKSLLQAGMHPQDIVVINDGSKDKTAEIAKSLGVTVFNNKVNLGKAVGVTNTLRSIFSQPRYKDLTHVSFLDADTLVDPKYFLAVRKRLSEDLKEVEEARKKGLQKKPISILCGRAKSLPHNWLTAFRAKEYWVSYAIYKPAQAQIRTTTVAPGCASTYSVEALQYVVWTDETVVEDMDATIQVALADGVIAYEKDAIVYTQDPSNLRDYIGQLGKRWYAGSWQVMGKHHLLWPASGWTRYFALVSYLMLFLYLAMFRPQFVSLILGSVTASEYVVSYLLLQVESFHNYLLPWHKFGDKYSRARLGWYCRATNGEPFLYIGIVLFVALKHSDYIPWIIGSLFFTEVVFSSIASLQERRFDILKYSLIYPFINVLNLALFVSKVGNIFGRKKSARREWYSPTRYAMKTETEEKKEVVA